MDQKRACAGTAVAAGATVVADPSDTAGVAGKDTNAASDWIKVRLFMTQIYEVSPELQELFRFTQPLAGWPWLAFR
jgi:hypothetical protein